MIDRECPIPADDEIARRVLASRLIRKRFTPGQADPLDLDRAAAGIVNDPRFVRDLDFYAKEI